MSFIEIKASGKTLQQGSNLDHDKLDSPTSSIFLSINTIDLKKETKC
jgi:hypothetical protein